MIRTDWEAVEPKIHYSGFKRTYTIYSLVNLDNGKRYIGRSKNLAWRLKQHFKAIEKHNHYNELINADSNCRFGFEVLEEYVTFEDRTQKERDYIAKYESYIESKGYNVKDHYVKTIRKHNAESISHKTGQIE